MPECHSPCGSTSLHFRRALPKRRVEQALEQSLRQHRIPSLSQPKLRALVFDVLQRLARS